MKERREEGEKMKERGQGRRERVRGRKGEQEEVTEGEEDREE